MPLDNAQSNTWLFQPKVQPGVYIFMVALLPFLTWAVVMVLVLTSNVYFDVADSSLRTFEPDNSSNAVALRAARWVRFLAYTLLSVLTYLVCIGWSVWVTYRMWKQAGWGWRGSGRTYLLTVVVIGLAGTLVVFDVPGMTAAKLPLEGKVLNDFVALVGQAAADARTASSLTADLGYLAAFSLLMAVCSSLAIPRQGDLSAEAVSPTVFGTRVLAAFPFLGSALLAVSILRTRAMMNYYAAFEATPSNGGLRGLEILADGTATYLGITYSLVVAGTFLPAAGLMLMRAQALRERFPEAEGELGKVDFAWLATSISILVPALVGGSDLLKGVVN